MWKSHHKGMGSHAIRVIAIAMAILLWATSISTFRYIPPKGVQCPTARVQKVMVVERDAAGFAHWVSRTPVEGDQEFQPCLCSLKASAHSLSAIGGGSIELMPVMGEIRPVMVVALEALVVERAEIPSTPADRKSTTPSAPPTPPPNA